MTQQNCNHRCVPCKDDAKSHVMSLLDHIVALDLFFLPFFDDLLHLKKGLTLKSNPSAAISSFWPLEYGLLLLAKTKSCCLLWL